MQITVRDVLASIIVMTIVFIIFSVAKKKRVDLYYLGIMLITFFMTCVFSLTGVSPVSGFHTDIRIADINFIPFVGMIDMVKSGVDFYVVANLLGNTLLFMPFGFFLPMLSHKEESFGRTVLFGFLTSLGIECSQLFLCRGTDVDDLILNTFGTVLGYLVYLLFRKLFPKLVDKLHAEAKDMCSKVLLACSVLVPYIIIIAFGFYDRYVIFHS